MKIILIADTENSRMKGLMHHRPLEENECALFDFPYEGKHSFWNKNVNFPISLVFCKKNGSVIDIKYLKAQQKTSVSPNTFDTKYVIEAHINAPKTYNIRKGSIVSITREKKRGSC